MIAVRQEAMDRYKRVRRDAFVRLEGLRERMDAWLDADHEQEPSMGDLATLEGLHGERLLIIAGLESAEREMLDTLLRARLSAATVAD